MGINNPKPIPDITIVKSADETVNNSAALQDDDELSLSLAVGTWHIQFRPKIDTTNSADFKFSYSSSQTVDVAGYCAYMNAIDTATISVTARTRGTSLATPLNIGGGGSGTVVGNALWDVVVYVPVACTFKIQWAQNTAEVSDTKLKAGSVLEVTKLV